LAGQWRFVGIDVQLPKQQQRSTNPKQQQQLLHQKQHLSVVLTKACYGNDQGQQMAQKQYFSVRLTWLVYVLHVNLDCSLDRAQQLQC
jgi:hypothetical protein